MLWLNTKKTDEGLVFSLTDNGKTPEETELSAKADLAYISQTEDFYTIYSQSWTTVKGYKVAGETIALDPKNDWLGKPLKINIQRTALRKGRAYKGQVSADTPQVLSHKYVSSLIEKYGLVGKVINLKKLFLDTKDEQRTKHLIDGLNMSGEPYEDDAQKAAVLPIYESIYLQFGLLERTEENGTEYDALISSAKEEEQKASSPQQQGKSYTPAEKYEEKLKAKELYLLKHLQRSKQLAKEDKGAATEPTLCDLLVALDLPMTEIVRLIVESSRI